MIKSLMKSFKFFMRHIIGRVCLGVCARRDLIYYHIKQQLPLYFISDFDNNLIAANEELLST